MSNIKQVKVDNWGIYFLQRLKHFFNRTDYCDLTLQFQDNAQLKVHRLVLSACTEYFELLERTCEMYEDCLVMPDDLQADVVVPIINFMYTGQLEFKMELLERLYQTSLVMNMPVLSKLLYSHRQHAKPPVVHSYSKQVLPKPSFSKTPKGPVPSSSGLNNKRTFSKAFEQSSAPKSKKMYVPNTPEIRNKPEIVFNNSIQNESSSYNFPVVTDKNHVITDPRPTRYELPEELDEDNIFDNSFTNISYTSKPLMIHPNSVKQYSSKTAAALFEDASTSKRFFHTSTDLVECRKITSNTNIQHTNIFEDETPESLQDESDILQPICHKENTKNASQLFDQILDNDGPKLTIETDDNKQTNNIDHAKIISEVLKKYPHLVKSNKNIKFKILNTPKAKKKRPLFSSTEEPEMKPKQEPPDFTYESDVIDSKQAAMLIALGAENVKGPWICLICGTPGKALHFTSYYKFRRHLVTVHNEKPIPNMCEYCGMKSLKRNCLLYHLYTKHGVPPPPKYKFPKCNYCNYIALTEALLVKHKMSHADNRLFRCNVCASSYVTSNLLLAHIQKTGHKISDKRTNLQCIYCLKVFLRESNLYAHLKTNHKGSARNDGIIDDSDEENVTENVQPNQKQDFSNQEQPRTTQTSAHMVKTEVPASFDNTFEDCSIPYQIEPKSDGSIRIISKKPKVLMPISNHKILNSGFNPQTPTTTSPSKTVHKKKIAVEPAPDQTEFLQEIDTDSSIPSNNGEEIVIIDNQEFILQNYQLVPKREMSTEEFVLPHIEAEDNRPTISTPSHLEYHTFHNPQPETTKMIVKKATNVNQPIQIVVSNEEEYKALMNSNHSIIFDNTDTNKTLTMLGGPNDSQLGTEAIDLDNAQSNEMMIIPENYPINVSESISADSSNIVVVYSHPVDDQNKQYQIITSQGLEAQFVQSSTVLTQNYGTVTTCSPDMLNTQVVESWPNSTQENINKLQLPCASGIQTVHIPTSIEVTSMENIQSNIEELPEVTMSQPESSSININQIVTNENSVPTDIYSQPHTIEQSVINPNDVTITHIVNDQHHQTITSLNILDHTVVGTEIQTNENNVIDHSATIISAINSESLNDAGISNENSTNIAELHISESVIVSNEQTITSQSDSSTQDNDVAKNSSDLIDDNNGQTNNLELLHPNPTTDFEIATNNEILDKNNLDVISTPQVINQNQNEAEISETVENVTKDIGETLNDPETLSASVDVSNTVKDVVNENVESVIMKNINSDREIREEIVTLASEWSEDETDTQTENVEPHIDSQETETTQDHEKSEEIEESIENIQQEMAKQVSLNKDANLHESIEEETDKMEDNSKVNNEVTQASQEKISSLLNDWDDNDSQEEDGNTDTNVTTNENETSETINEHIDVNNCSVIVEPEVKKDDKIKSLVSDWDEEDEEETKN